MSRPIHDSITHVNEPDDARLFRRIGWHILPIVWLCFVLNYLDKTNIAFAQLQMKDELGFSDAVFGLGASALFAGLIAFEVPSNVILANVGIRKTLLRIMSLWGACTVAMALVKSPTHFYILRFMVGAFEAGFAPGVLYYLSLWYPDKRRAQAAAIFYTATSVARIISGPVAATLMTKLNGTLGLQGWQWLFVGEGLPCILFGLITYGILSDTPAQAKWLAAEDRERLQNHLRRDGEIESHFVWKRLSELLLDPRMWACGAIGFLVLIATLGLTYWQPALLKGMGLSIAQTGWYSTIPALCGVVASVLIARHSDATGERCWHFVCTALLGAVGLFLATRFSHNVFAALACLTCTWIGIASAYALTWAMPGRILVGRHAATGLALITVMQGVAGIVGPYAIAALKTATGNFNASLYLMGGSCVAAAVVCIGFYRATSSDVRSTAASVGPDRVGISQGHQSKS
ncbi:MFS transporter (plasmid) [Paraburkholderia sp. PGU19]|uniref:MFS transporter n=1 Tax=Paraburkholderia sp. PGU19 TaxID=2735434 RepID=UPI0015DBC799|nr:MFS transporter [Paraburkholderia sp. PGU19]BCG04444.1 MFS transporter [Paraburkholderia sp. PGU19]